MHIGILVNDLQPYGSQRVAVQLAESLAEQVERVTLVTVEAPDRDAMGVATTVGRRQITRRGGGARGFISLVTQLRSLLVSEQFDLVISHMVMSNVCVLAASRTIRRPPPVVVTEHNLPSNLSIERSATALRWLVSKLYPHARRVIGVSNAVSEAARSAYRLPRANVVTIYNPVDVDRIRAASSDSEPPHHWLTGPRKTRAAVCVGGFRLAKGQDLLVEAMTFASDLRVIFVGDGVDRVAVERLAAKLGLSDRVHFAGYREDVGLFVAHARCLVVPSRWEGFGLVAVEAAALGVPVVATRVEGLSELVPRYVPGVLVGPEEPRALARAIAEVDDIAHSKVSAAALSDFRPATVAQKYLLNAQVLP